MRNLLKLTLDDIKELMLHKEVRTYEDDAEVQGAALVVDGTFEVLKNQEEECLIINPGYAVGLHQLEDSSLSKLRFKAKKNAKTIILEKIDLEESSPVYSILSKKLSFSV